MFATGALDSHSIGRMLLRYRYRLYPDAPQRDALARAFGCARVVFNTRPVVLVPNACRSTFENGSVPPAGSVMIVM